MYQHIFFLFSYFFFTILLWSQNPSLLKAKQMAKFTAATQIAGTKSILIKCPYAEPQIIDSQTIQELNEGIITRVELYYTQFKQSNSFNQIELNKKRYDNLQKFIPQLYQSPMISFQNFEQTQAQDLETAETYFHGFVIYYLPKSSEKWRSEEIESLKKLLKISDINKVKNMGKYDTEPLSYFDIPAKFGLYDCDIVSYLTEHIKYPAEAVAKNIRGVVSVSFTVNRSGGIQDFKFTNDIGHGCGDAVKEALEYMPKWAPASKKGMKVNTNVQVKVYFGVHPPAESSKGCSSILIYDKELELSNWRLTPQQRIISQTLSKQNNLSNSIFCMDITGSMGPYIGDLMEFIKANSKSIPSFYFFNDGDLKYQNQKTIGSTGGIYTIKNTDFKSIVDFVLSSMANGNGGDIPENDLETLLLAQKENPNASRLILAADNYAFPRDAELFKEINKPLLIILCGSQYKINEKWLTLAYKMKAQLSINGAFIPKFPVLNEGDNFSVRGENFRWINQEFITLKKTD